MNNTKSHFKKFSRLSAAALLITAGQFVPNSAHAYGTVSRANCGSLAVLESITYTVFPWEFDDYLYVNSQQWTRFGWQPYWTYRGMFSDGWDWGHARAGEFFAFSYWEAGYVVGDHYSYPSDTSTVTYAGRTIAGDCNLFSWY